MARSATTRSDFHNRRSTERLIHFPRIRPIMRRILVLMIAMLAMSQAWSVIGQLDLSPDSEVEQLTDSMMAFLNDTEDLDTSGLVEDASILNLTNETAPDINITGTPSLDQFMETPINESTLDSTFAITGSMWDFLKGDDIAAPLYTSESAVDMNTTWTNTQRTFLGLPPVETAPLYTKHVMS